MADEAISGLPVITAIAGEDLIAAVDDPSVTPITSQATITQLATFLASNTTTLTNHSIDWTNNTMTFSSAEILAACSDETGTGSLVFGTSPTIVTPTIDSFISATHSHLTAAGGGLITAAAISDFSTAVAATASVTANTAKISYTDAAAVALNTAKITNATHTGDATGSTALTIASGVVTLAKMANIATSRFIGRVTAATGVPEALTGTQATTLLDTFTSALQGLVPASGGGTTNFLRADGTFAVPAGGGDMVLADVQTVIGAKTFGTIGGAVDKFILAGSTSGSTIVNAAAVAGSTTITLPSTTTTLAGLGVANVFTANQKLNDNIKTLFGTGSDASILYDGTDLIIDPAEVGSGAIQLGLTADTLTINLHAASKVDEAQIFTENILADNSIDVETQYGRTFMRIKDPTSGSEQSNYVIATMVSGALTNMFALQGHLARVDILASDFAIPTTKSLFYDGGVDTSRSESSADVLDDTVGSILAHRMAEIGTEVNNVFGKLSVLATTATDGFPHIPNTAGTPTGTPTSYTGKTPLVYDDTNDILYAYTGAAWADVGGAGGAGLTFAKMVKPDDETVTSSTTFQDDDDISFTPTINKTYGYILLLITNASSTPDIKFIFSVPTGATMISNADFWGLAANPETTGDRTSSFVLNGLSADVMSMMTGRIVMSSTAGNVTMQWAQNTSNATGSIMKAGSYMVVWEES